MIRNLLQKINIIIIYCGIASVLHSYSDTLLRALPKNFFQSILLSPFPKQKRISFLRLFLNAQTESMPPPRE